MLSKWRQHVSSWLGTVLTAHDKQRLLLPQQPTFQPACPLFAGFRPLHPGERTYGKGVCGVRS